MRKMKIGAFTSLVLVMSLLLSIAAPLFTVNASSLAELKENLDISGDGKINYLAIGSAAAAGVGVDTNDSYPEIVKEILAGSGKNVELSKFAIDGMRAEELRYLFDKDFAGDAFTEKNFLGSDGVFASCGGVDALRTQLVSAVSNAELITLDIGSDNYLEYVLSYIFSGEYDADFTRFDDSLRGNIDQIKGRFEDVLEGYIKDADSAATGPLLQRAIDGLAYALVGFAECFDDILTYIYAINPDARITVVNLRNPMTGLTATLDGVDFPIPLAEVYGVLVDLANIYIANLSEYSNSYYFAYAGENGQPTTFAGEISAPSSEFEANLESYAGESESAKAALKSLVKLGLNYSGLDLTAAAEAPTTASQTLDAYVKSILEAAKTPGYNLTASSEYRAITASKAMMTLLSVSVRYNFAKLTTLPNKDGHTEIAYAVLSAIENSTMGSEVLEKDMNEVYGFLFKYLGFDRETLLDMEYAFNPYYNCKSTSYYVAIGDGSANNPNSYVEKLAEKLGLAGTKPSNRKYKKFAKEGLTPAKALENIAEYKSAILSSDIITLSFNNVATTRYMIDQLMAALQGGAVKDNDWSAILGPDTAAMVDEVVGMMKSEIGKGGFGALGDALVVAIESYAYAYAQRLVSYPALIEAIHAIKPGALVLVVGTYNDMKDMTIEMGDTVLPLGDYVQYLIDIANLETLALSVLSEKTAYIAAPDVETNRSTHNIVVNPDSTWDTLMSVRGFLSDVDGKNLNPSREGHEYVADTVVGSINLITNHPNCDYDNDCDNRCDVCKAKRAVKGHQYDAVCDTTCNACGSHRIAQAHVYDGGCDSECDVCGLVREVPDHTYGGACDTECNGCGATRTVAVQHNFGDWTVSGNEKSRVCSVCGTVDKADVNAPTEEDQGSTVIIIVCVAAVVLAAGGAGAFFLTKKKSTVASKENDNQNTDN